MIQPERIKSLNDLPEREGGNYILYWMQASQRHSFNHAVEYGLDRANEARLPLVVVFGITDNYPEANLRHYRFMAEGLKDVRAGLAGRGIPFRIYAGSPEEVAVETAQQARMVVVDRGYLRHQKRWREAVAERAGCRVVQVESDVLVPVEAASGKEEYAARTLRPKIQAAVKTFLAPLKERTPLISGANLRLDPGLDPDDPAFLDRFDLDRSVPPVDRIVGGQTEARRRLRRFLEKTLNSYAEGRNDITESNTTGLSPYLHFGQISPLEIVLQLIAHAPPSNGNVAALIEELIVRRELAMNFVEYNPDYDSLKALPDWAMKTLEKHREDKRDYLYRTDQFEDGTTHDSYWNAAMREMREQGTMKGYMRMYWGKKILEWSPSPEEAFETILYLNNKYFLDGRDPNSYANVAWIFGKHDRPWKERPVFGTIRYMNAAGLERKFDVKKYVENVGDFRRTIFD